MKRYKVKTKSTVLVAPQEIAAQNEIEAVKIAYANWMSNCYEYGKQILLTSEMIHVQWSSTYKEWNARQIRQNGTIAQYGMHYEVTEI